MANLDTFLAQISAHDTKRKLQVGQDILNYLNVEENSLECSNLSAFIDSIIHWLNNSNFKVAQSGMEILSHLTIRMKEDFKPYLSSVLSPTIDRMGDSKDSVREYAKTLLMKLINFVSTAQIILEKLIPSFSHKNWRVREEMCFFLQECLLRYGVVGSTNGQLYVSKFIPSLVILLSDPNLQVRDTSMATLVEIYKHVGDKLRHEILRKHSNMPQQKLQTLLSKFDEVANTGDVQQPAPPPPQPPSQPTNNGNNKIGLRSRNVSNATAKDEVDFKKTNAFKRATSAPPVKRSAINKYPSGGNSTKSTGAADEEMFMNSFEEVPRISLFNVRDLEKELNRIKDVCSNSNAEWEKRMECLRLLRSLLIAGAADYDEFYPFLKPLEVPFQTSVKDLRSQVVREACISIAYLSQRIGHKCDRFAEALLPHLIQNIQNSAKIMSSSAVVAIRFIIQHTHASRLIPIIAYNISSKSKEIRKACCEFLDQLLHTWSTHTLEKHVGTLQEAIKKGIGDADPEARVFARKAFWGFADKFKLESDYLLNSLDSGKQRMLQGEQMPNWSSTNSLNKVSSYNTRPQTYRTNSVSTNGSIESINRHLSSLKRSAIPVSSPKNHTNPRTPITPVRATSAIDIDAQRRARAKANSYLNQPKVLLNSVYSLTNSKRAESTVSNDERSSRRSRVSKSQPGSRSTSPSSRLSYYSNIPSGDSRGKPRRKSGAISREQSPTRTTPAYERRLSNSSSASRTRNHLMNSDLDLSNKLASLHHNDDLLDNSFVMHGTPRKKFFDDQSDESETSSICSDTSFNNYGVRKVEDISKILENLSSTHWTDRKDGLLSLATFFRQSDEQLNPFELKRITDIFTRMLVDPHTKAFSLFLTILNELIQIYKNELNSWLYILMTRLFLKAGSDTLGSIQTRINKTFELIRESFPIDHQFDVIMRLLSDQTQTLNTKVKLAVLQYLSKLIFQMDSAEFAYNRANSHDIQTALMKIISWTADIKSSELRKISQDTIVDLYNLNSSEMTLYINALPKTYQDAAQQIIQHKRKTRLNQSPVAVMQTPYMIKNLYANKMKYYDETANLNPDEIYDSLKKTSDEIQKYSFSSDSENLTPNNLNSSSHNGGSTPYPKSFRQKKFDALSSASLDSGISQIDGLKNLTSTPVAHNDSITHKSASKIPITSPSSDHFFHHASPSTPLSSAPSANGHSANVFQCDFNSNELDVLNQNLLDLIQWVQDSPAEEVGAKCKDLYKQFLERLPGEKNTITKVLLLRAVGQIVHKHAFEDYAESTLVTLLETSKDSDKEVVRTSDDTTNYALFSYDTGKLFLVLKPYINHTDTTLNNIAINMLTRLVELNNKDTIEKLMPEMMPPLLQAYDNPESAVRKATVFCMVAIYGAVGDSINPYLKSLSATKMKLLRLYIDRSIQTNNRT